MRCQIYYNRKTFEQTRIHYTGYTISFTSEIELLGEEIAKGLIEQNVFPDQGCSMPYSANEIEDMAQNGPGISAYKEARRSRLIGEKWEEVAGCGPVYTRDEIYNSLCQIYDYYGWNKAEINKRIPNRSIIESIYDFFYPGKREENAEYIRKIINHKD
ncbi:MAG: hypothetical protein ACLFPF_05345 [Halanaerobiales bacterium]